jgi:hypothetical protein
MKDKSLRWVKRLPPTHVAMKLRHEWAPDHLWLAVREQAKATTKRQYGGWMSFLSVLEAVGKGFEKGLKWAVTYAVPVEKLVGLLFPAIAPVANEVADATSLIQTAVLLVEQKYAASGVQSGTGAQKLAEVMLLTESAVTGLLTKAGISVDATYVANIVSAVVAILNVQQSQTAAA